MPNQSNTISIDPTKLNRVKDSQSNEWILKGLRRKSVAFVIAPPDSGKGYLCLSIAYELATKIDIIGVRHEDSPKLRTLYWPMEDRCENTAERILSHYNDMSQSTISDCIANIELYNKYSPIAYSSKQLNTPLAQLCEQAKNELIEAAKSFDMLIIDTCRESMGTADEVKDDSTINAILKEISVTADVAIIAVHHPTKNVARGLESISSVSASGLSYTIANSRLHLYLDKQTKKNKPDETRLIHTKANFLNAKQRLNSVIQWSDNNLPYINNSAFQTLKRASSKTPIEPTFKIKPTDIKISQQEPKTYSFSDEELQSTTNKMVNPNDEIVNDELLQSLARYRQQKK